MTLTLGRFFAFVAFAVSASFASKQPLTVWIMPNGASPKDKLEQTLAEFTKQTGIPMTQAGIERKIGSAIIALITGLFTKKSDKKKSDKEEENPVDQNLRL